MAQLDKGGFFFQLDDGTGTGTFVTGGYIFVEEIDFLHTVEHYLLVIHAVGQEVPWKSPTGPEVVHLVPDPSTTALDQFITTQRRDRLRIGELRYIRCECHAATP